VLNGTHAVPRDGLIDLLEGIVWNNCNTLRSNSILRSREITDRRGTHTWRSITIVAQKMHGMIGGQSGDMKAGGHCGGSTGQQTNTMPNMRQRIATM